MISGFVQGVGFRPFVFRLASELNIKGHVTNNAGQVTIVAKANKPTLEQFYARLLSQAPVNANPVIQSISSSTDIDCDDFVIRPSLVLYESDIHILPDIACCEDCVTELFDATNRRYRYPFINCTQCGPRSSIIRALPYDRGNTSMQGFKMCPECDAEYKNPENRRFHAEPIACEKCGPVLSYVDDGNTITDNKLALDATISALKQGKIIAVKGIGGYHLMCDATSVEAIELVRRRKPRPHKPFAVLMTVAQMDDYCVATDQERVLLQQSSSPIVLIKRHPVHALPNILTPGLDRLGVMLPNNPLQHLLCQDFQKPLLTTSANLSGEPIICDNTQATQRLRNLCDAFLHHDRDIVRVADDPVMICAGTKPQLIRNGRGIAPSEFALPFTLRKPVLAVGGYIKNTVALAWQDRMVISEHNGDLGSLRGFEIFKQRINDLQHLYQVTAQHVICDAHPAYSSALWAAESGLPITKVLHHHAHASSLLIENSLTHEGLIFCWDGIGLGDDGTLWGGETFFGHPGRWQRVVSFNTFRLPGGEKTARGAWRVAASLRWHVGLDYESKQHPVEQLKSIWSNNINCPESSAVGRLFSAAAALLGLVETETFEGHGPMHLEALAETAQAAALGLSINNDESGLLRIDWQPLVLMLVDNTLSKAYRARCFHESLAECATQIVQYYSKNNRELRIGFSGGVFQNQLLLRLIKQRLEPQLDNLMFSAMVPVNDGGLSAGQIVEYQYQ